MLAELDWFFILLCVFVTIWCLILALLMKLLKLTDQPNEGKIV
jgi:hypothetical protein